MGNRSWAWACVAVAMAVTVMPVTVAEQAPAAAASAPPRTPWGDPDLQGIWTRIHFNVGGVPFERPRELGTKSELTDTELQARMKAEQDDVASRPTGTSFDDEISPYVTPSRQTSVIVDPPDGRLPSLTPEAQKRIAALAEAARQRRAKGEIGPETFSINERCITRGFPNVMNPAPPTSSGMQIVQAPGYVAIRIELFNEYRIIPLDNRPTFGPKLRQWWGQSRGHWEGNTLVVEVTNFNDRPKIPPFQASGEQMRIVERFTRTRFGELDYQYTVEDPATFTRPWTAKASWGLIDRQLEIMEYACHAGNYDLESMIKIAQAEAWRQGK